MIFLLSFLLKSSSKSSLVCFGVEMAGRLAAIACQRFVFLDPWSSLLARRSDALASGGSLPCVGLPSGLQRLELGHSFNQPICNMQWPHLLQTLHFGMDFNRPLQSVLPSNTLRAPLRQSLISHWLAFAGHHSCGFCNLVLISTSPWLPQICPARAFFFNKTCGTCLCRSHCCALPLAKVSPWNAIGSSGHHALRNLASSNRSAVFRLT